MGATPQWWDKKKYPNPFKEVFGAALTLRDEQIYREQRALTNLCYYGGEQLLGLRLRDYTRRGTGEKSSINATANITNSLHAEITQQRPRMMMLTSGGDYKLQQVAKDINKVLDGQNAEDGQDDLSPILASDTLIFGDAFEKVYIDHVTERVAADRVLQWELAVPEADAYYGRPRTMYHVTNVDRGVLMATYEDMADEIKKASGAVKDPFFVHDAHSDLIPVVEAYHLPSLAERGDPESEDYEDATDDGRHFICVSTCRLYEEPWKTNRFPYFNLKWKIPNLGFWSTSLIDELRSEQAAINRMDRFIKESMARAGLKVLVDNGAGVLNSHIDDLVGTIIRGNFSNGGMKPEWVAYATVNPEFFQHLQWRLDTLYSQNGINQLSAQSLLPAQLSGSGTSIKAYEQSKSRRFIDFAKRYERFHRAVAEYKLELIRKAYKETGKYAVTYRGKRQIEIVDWDAIAKIDPKHYYVAVYPTSSLPSTPAGKFAMLQDWVNAQWISPEDAKRLADFPELEDYTELETSSYMIVREMIDAILEEGKEQTPEPMMDLMLAASEGTKAYLLARRRGWYPPQHLDLLREFVTTCLDMSKPPEPPPVPGGEPVLGGAPPPDAMAAAAGGPAPAMPPGAPPPPPGVAA
ncbi:MAG TPA: hypothetical protein VFU97_24515 [Xanthobacteraceae bacterium]|nr:hypothetical protein [Xanthobacteraceae bacterium]